MAFYTYILKCADGLYYTGHTDDIDVRIAQHQTGYFPGFTAQRLPVTLMWASDFPTRDQAFDAEIIIKKWSRAKKEAMMRGDWDAVGFFARPPKERGDGVSTSLDTSGVGGGTGKTPPALLEQSRKTVRRRDTSGKKISTDQPDQSAHVKRSRDTSGKKISTDQTNQSAHVERSRDTRGKKTSTDQTNQSAHVERSRDTRAQ